MIPGKGLEEIGDEAFSEFTSLVEEEYTHKPTKSSRSRTGNSVVARR